MNVDTDDTSPLLLWRTDPGWRCVPIPIVDLTNFTAEYDRPGSTHGFRLICEGTFAGTPLRWVTNEAAYSMDAREAFEMMSRRR